MDLIEGVGENSSPPRSFGSCAVYDIKNDVYNRLVETGNPEAVTNPELLREHLDSHFARLPVSYGLDINVDKAEDVLLHQKILVRAKEPDNRPVYHVRFLENYWTRFDDAKGQDDFNDFTTSKAGGSLNDKGIRKGMNDFETCSKLEDLNLDVRKNFNDTEEILAEDSSRRHEVSCILVHEVIFSTIDKPKLLSQLSALLSDIGLNIREAHVFSTIDGYSLDVFVVDGWPVEDTKALHEELGKAIARSEGTWSGSSHSRSAAEKVIIAQSKPEDWEIDKRLLKIGERIASGSCGDLYRGMYLGMDVAIKVLRSEHLNDTLEDEFAQEIAILKQVQHRNVVRFIGACTNSPHLCIITEFMPGGSLYEYLHKNHVVLKLSQLLSFAIDVCKGMEYLHQNNIIHRDLKAANLLMDSNNVVKVADFGVARFQNNGGVMTAETGTYRWMAPEIINHQPYDQKADVFSFAIVIWELLTAKVPYDTMTPLQAALGVRQGLRPELPENAHPRLLDLMQRCWVDIPSDRPSFSEIKVELELLLHEIENTIEASKGS
ncbi:serine/threonine-protein kinase STY46-like [Solanum pennellii]|uniref:Serine/threonine-protein kinase STY46-like n=1 Tax=Solanum pennellii TaxID=28526 RepID=A0ABM1GP21_SOLPN|nr:serine/threonine-protein kinase STY46-like [Solanum pennellii]